MDVFDLFDKDACNLSGKIWSDQRTWHQYFTHKETLKTQWKEVVLVDMVGYPIEWALPISNELFFDQTYPDWTYFALYCHSGGSSGYVQKQLKPKLPQYNFINLTWGIWWYHLTQI